MAGAFALPPHDNGEGDVPWRDSSAPARYLYRFGIAVEYRGKGLGKLALESIGELSRRLGARYLRLYVAYENQPAISLYQKAGFARLPGEFGEFCWRAPVLEYAFEKEVRKMRSSYSGPGRRPSLSWPQTTTPRRGTS